MKKKSTFNLGFLKKISFKKIFGFPFAPKKHFKRLVIVSLCLLIVTVGIHVILFQRILSESAFDITGEMEAVTINEKKLEAVLLKFEEKEAVRSAVVGE